MWAPRSYINLYFISCCLNFLMLKSRIHWRAGLRSLAHAVVECAGTGVCTSDYAALGLRHVRRPMYPLDAI